jgi:predicted porin
MGYQGGESSFNAVASYVQTDQTTTTASNLDQTARQTMESVSANGEFAVTAKTRIGVTPSFSRIEFPEVGFTNSDILTLPVDAYYAVTPKTDVSIGYAYNKTTTQNGIGDSKGSFFNIGMRGQFAPKLSGQVRVGEDELKPKVGQSTKQLGVESSLNYAYSPRTSFSLYANNEFAPSSAGNQTEVFSTGLAGNFTLSEQWSASVSVGTSSTKYLTSPSRTDRFVDASVSLSYVVTSYLDLQASYLYRSNSSPLEALTFDDNLTTLTAACRF